MIEQKKDSVVMKVISEIGFSGQLSFRVISGIIEVFGRRVEGKNNPEVKG
jgi:hypothetical protein